MQDTNLILHKIRTSNEFPQIYKEKSIDQLEKDFGRLLNHCIYCFGVDGAVLNFIVFFSLKNINDELMCAIFRQDDFCDFVLCLAKYRPQKSEPLYSDIKRAQQFCYKAFF